MQHIKYKDVVSAHMFEFKIDLPITVETLAEQNRLLRTSHSNVIIIEIEVVG
ncbi:hypothetical protein R50072_00240 [Simiduia litorea]